MDSEVIILSTLVPVKFWVFLFFVPPDLKCKLKLVYWFLGVSTVTKKIYIMLFLTFEILSQCIEFCHSDNSVRRVAAISLGHCDFCTLEKEL